MNEHHVNIYFTNYVCTNSLNFILNLNFLKVEFHFFLKEIFRKKKFFLNFEFILIKLNKKTITILLILYLLPLNEACYTKQNNLSTPFISYQFTSFAHRKHSFFTEFFTLFSLANDCLN